MPWFQRDRDTEVAASEPDDSLVADLAALRRYLNRHAERLPAVSVVTAHQIGDVLRAVIDTAGDRSLDAHTAVRLRGFLTDYVPTTVRTFLAADDQVAALQEQLERLLEEATTLLGNARSYDSDAVLTQGRFLATKFSRSDLDL